MWSICGKAILAVWFPAWISWPTHRWRREWRAIQKWTTMLISLFFRSIWKKRMW